MPNEKKIIIWKECPECFAGYFNPEEVKHCCYATDKEIAEMPLIYTCNCCGESFDDPKIAWDHLNDANCEED